eukprot:CAMPEP_0185747992 /NCGR_PEP_ID=MMETSP1174-20130828/6639_1 /TAXON_ID=35687 /ORGANISM="Dictyocha speculum, Strain CCMP1381" /LENGTH=183 /DNA_ID=CAMNT_0028423441 /DNA_START=90 /DNA_END=641 /DNA_ORIENTATION=+
MPLTLPMEVVTKRLQTAKKRSSLFVVIQNIIEEKGLLGFYSGIAAYLVLCMKPAIQYSIYDHLRTFHLGERRKGAQRATTELSASQAFLLGALSRAVATIVVYPYIRAKVLLQAERTSDAKGGCIQDILRRVFRSEGFLALYRGVEPELFRGMLSSAIMLMVKERIYSFNKKLILGTKRDIKS